MPKQYGFAPAALVALTLSFAPIFLTGCSGGATAASTTPRLNMVAGNWQFNSSAASAAQLPAISGEILTASVAAGTAVEPGIAHRFALSAGVGTITGILHAQGSTSCVPPATSFEVAGSADSQGNVTLTGPLAGGTLTITGALASDGKSLTNATYNVAGGTCAFAKPALATAQAYNPISGSYSGTFVDADGLVASISATLNQSADANGDGNYTLTGTAGLPNIPCFSSPTLTVSATQVTGGTFTFSFTDPASSATVTANGTFSSDASTLTVSNWTLSNCSTDSGTGTMTRQ